MNRLTQAYRDNAPNAICAYIYELAGAVNKFYHETRILAEPDAEITPVICEQLYDLALMSYRPLSSEEMTAFLDRSNQILEKLADLEA